MPCTRLFATAAAILALCASEPAFAANTAATVQKPVTANDCATFGTYPNVADSGIVCTGGNMVFSATGAAGMTLQPNYFATNGPGIVLNQAHHGLHITKNTGGAAQNDDIADVFIDRTANYTGGTNGFVNGNLRITDTVSAGTTAFEWGLTSVMDNSGALGDHSENVAIYAQSLKRNNGGTWASVSELKDYGANPGSPSVTTEYDLEVTGGDSGASRVNQDLWAKSLDGNAATASYGIRLMTDTHATYGTGLYLNGSFGTGIDLSHGSYLGNALILGEAQHACVDSLCNDYLYHTGGVLYYHTAGGNLISFSDTGQVSGSSISGGAISGTTGTFSSSVSAASFSGSHSGANIDASNRLTIASGQKVCLDGATCNYSAWLNGTTVIISASGANYSFNTAGQIGAPTGGLFAVGFSTGVTCSGAPSGSFATVGGIVTHC